MYGLVAIARGHSPLGEEATEELAEGAPDVIEHCVPALHALRLGGSAPTRRTGPRTGRNDPCPCGSGRKYKKCCGAN